MGQRGRMAARMIAAVPHGREAPINRRSLRAEIADFVRDLIAEGELTPGRRISERNLCECLGISRTPLREAL